MSFQKGDLVRLKSGGPVMTVTLVLGSTMECKWFSGSKSQKDRYAIEALDAVDPEELKKGKK